MPTVLLQEYGQLQSDIQSQGQAIQRWSQPISQYLPDTALHNPIATMVKPGAPAPQPPVLVSVIGDADVSRTTAAGFGGLPGFSSTSASGGGGLLFNPSGALGLAPNQRFLFSAGVWANGTNGQSHAPGSFSDNSTTFGLSALYSIGRSYATGVFLYDLGHVSTDASGVVGSYGAHGAAGDLELGHVFTLWTPPGGPNAPVTNGFHTILLDLSAHVGDTDERGSSFVDSTGTANGSSFAYAWRTGVDAKLGAWYPLDSVLLSPYVKAGFDYAFSTNTAVNSATPGAPPVFAAALDRTEARFEGGLEVLTKSRLSFNLDGYYIDGSTTKTVGGQFTMRVLFP